MVLVGGASRPFGVARDRVGRREARITPSGVDRLGSGPAECERDGSAELDRPMGDDLVDGVVRHDDLVLE